MIGEPFAHIIRHDKEYIYLGKASIIKMAYFVDITDEMVGQLKANDHEVGALKFMTPEQFHEMFENGETFGEPYYQRIAFEKIANS